MGIAAHGDALDKSAQNLRRLGAGFRIIQRACRSVTCSVDIRELGMESGAQAAAPALASFNWAWRPPAQAALLESGPAQAVGDGIVEAPQLLGDAASSAWSSTACISSPRAGG